jgi:signal transduction histidine kinase
LRNPLSVIRSSNYFLQRRVQYNDDKIGKHFKRVDDQVSLCDAIVKDLLEYTEGRHVAAFHQEFAGWLAELVQTQGKEKELEVHLRMAPHLPKLSYDREKIERVIVNLLNNAVQAVRGRKEESERLGTSYSPRVDMEVFLKENELVVGLRDNGIGMELNTLAHAFEPLFTTRARGTGMGLAIVKKIVEEHGGSITMESRLGEGTKVQFTLPLTVPQAGH